MEELNNMEELKISDVEEEQIITPWKVESTTKINYDKLINNFGCKKIDNEILERFVRLTGQRLHPWLERGIFFAHRDLDKILDAYENNEMIYLYTGRGATSESLHLGHLIPFMFCKYLQDVFGAIIVIQMSDDEKFYFKTAGTIDDYINYTYSNIKDIIACGFNPHKTLIFSNSEYMNRHMYKNAIKMNKCITGNQIRGIFGLNLDNNIGQLSWPIFQSIPAFSNSFNRIFGDKHVYCLVPYAIDQDPYFRLARDFAESYKQEGYLKPASIMSTFIVGLEGVNGKMSSSDGSVSLFLDDDENTIRDKIFKHAFSGGGATKREHMLYGGNLLTDVSYQYLVYFMEDMDELKQVAYKYANGIMMSSEIKKIMSDCIVQLIQNHQHKKAMITKEDIECFMDDSKQFDMTMNKCVSSDIMYDYTQIGTNFDLTFGYNKY